jgi:hypothetical protein
MRGRERREGQTRPGTTARGYGTSHARERERVARVVEAGGGYCAQCGGWIEPGSKWYLGHDHRNGGYAGPEHPKCGVGERNKRVARKRRVRSEVW